MTRVEAIQEAWYALRDGYAFERGVDADEVLQSLGVTESEIEEAFPPPPPLTAREKRERAKRNKQFKQEQQALAKKFEDDRNKEHHNEYVAQIEQWKRDHPGWQVSLPGVILPGGTDSCPQQSP